MTQSFHSCSVLSSEAVYKAVLWAQCKHHYAHKLTMNCWCWAYFHICCGVHWKHNSAEADVIVISFFRFIINKVLDSLKFLCNSDRSSGCWWFSSVSFNTHFPQYWQRYQLCFSHSLLFPPTSQHTHHHSVHTGPPPPAPPSNLS